ncbi:hypothetical protein BSA145_09040 [Bacillus safensis]|uniref:Uncharacterized protein n=1 Tax=Bacillus safensis TaxID=561879 RepID=A0A1L6ZHM6_BACIA|nr:hypothetical protein BSA145_09040 [Bacillus safensis]
MGNFSTKILKAWLSIPRWFRMFIPTAITIYVLWTLLINGIKNIFQINSQSLIISLIASAIILFIFNKFNKKTENKGENNLD